MTAPVSFARALAAVRSVHDGDRHAALQQHIGELNARADAVRALHAPVEEWLSPFTDRRGLRCRLCGGDGWPCPTVAALDGAA